MPCSDGMGVHGWMMYAAVQCSSHKKWNETNVRFEYSQRGSEQSASSRDHDQCLSLSTLNQLRDRVNSGNGNEWVLASSVLRRRAGHSGWGGCATMAVRRERGSAMSQLCAMQHCWSARCRYSRGNDDDDDDALQAAEARLLAASLGYAA